MTVGLDSLSILSLWFDAGRFVAMRDIAKHARNVCVLHCAVPRTVRYAYLESLKITGLALLEVSINLHNLMY